MSPKVFIENGGSPDKIIWSRMCETYICDESFHDNDIEFDYYLVAKEETVDRIQGQKVGKFLSCFGPERRYMSGIWVDKVHQLRVATEKFLVPWNVLYTNEYIPKFKGPIIVRPRKASGSRGLYIFEDGIQGLDIPYKIPSTEPDLVNSLLSILSRKYPSGLIIQEYLPEHYTMFNMDIVMQNGKLVDYFCHIKEGAERFTHWFNGIFIRSKFLREVALKFVEFAVGCGVTDGLINPEFIVNSSNKDVYFIECNFRYSGTMSYPFSMYGYDIIQDYVRIAQGYPAEGSGLPDEMYVPYKNLEEQWIVEESLHRPIDLLQKMTYM